MLFINDLVNYDVIFATVMVSVSSDMMFMIIISERYGSIITNHVLISN